MSDLFEEVVRIARQGGLDILQRDAMARGTVMQICKLCHAFMSERPAAIGELSGLDNSRLCKSCAFRCTPVATEVIQ